MDKLFKSYCNIENAYNKSYIYKIFQHEYNTKYVISEKIHGSNLGFYINLKTLQTYFASRNCILDEDNFMLNTVKIVFNKIKPDISKLIDNTKKVLKNEIDDYEYLCVFGELFGGLYPHENVEKDNHAVRIQKGVYYTPFNYFDAFDIALIRNKSDNELNDVNELINSYKTELEDTGEDNPDYKIIKNTINNKIKSLEDQKNLPIIRYVDFNQFLDILKDTNIQSVPILKMCDTLKEALEFDKVFESEVYKQFNLPKIENNFAEGVVIKSIEEIAKNNGRIILKNKNDKFAEISHHKKKEDIDKTLAPETNELINLLNDYINENRLDSVLSKIPGPYKSSDFGKLIKEFTKDILDEFNKYNNDKINKVKELNEYKAFTKNLSNKASGLLRKKFLELAEY